MHARLLHDPDNRTTTAADTLAPAALQLAAQLGDHPDVLGRPESALLAHWLDVLAASDQR